MIIRVTKGNDPYARIDKVPINDERLSWKALGILTYLLSKPNDWKVMEANLINSHRNGRDAVRSGLKELIEAGYIERKMERKDGKFLCVEYTVHERPINTPLTEKPSTVMPLAGNHPRLKNEKELTNESTKKPLSGKPDAAIEVLEYLNEKTESRYRPGKTTLAPIHGRLAEGATIDDCKAVIDFKVAEWARDDKMSQYLRPITLFGPTKFPGYLSAAIRWEKNGRPLTKQDKFTRDMEAARHLMEVGNGQ